MEETSWKNFVPSSYWDTVTCHFVKEEETAAYVCIREGALIECCDGVIERSCLLNCTDAESIEQFFTYHPYMEYFIVKDKENLVIISNGKELNVSQTFNGVKKYEVGDYSSQGFPQIKIFPLDNQKEPFIAEFSSTMGNPATNHNNDYICSRLQPKLKEAKDLLATYIKDVESKRKLRSESMLRLLNNYSAEDYPPPREMQCFLGSKAIGKNSKTNLAKPEIQLLHSWQMAVDKQWLLGIIVKNSSQSVISNLKIFLHEKQKGRISYGIKRLNSENIDEIFRRLDLNNPTLPPKPVVIWQEENLDAKLSPGKGCVLISTFPFPDFTATSVITIDGQIYYSIADHEGKTEEVHSQELPQCKITARNVLDGSLLPSGPYKNFFVPIGRMAVSEMVALSIHMGMTYAKPIEHILTEDIGFSQIPDDNLFYCSSESNHALSGCVIQKVDISKKVLKMHLYARNHELLVLLVYSILEAIPGSWDIKYAGARPATSDGDSASAVTVDQCFNALSKEIMFLLSSLLNWRRKHCSNRICIDVDSYSKFRKILESLQKQTDKVFHVRMLK